MNRKKFDQPEIDTIEGLSLKLIVANQKLQESEMQRTKMIEDISHDLRAPLTAIRNAVDYLESIEQSEELSRAELRKVVELLDYRTKTLETLIADLYFLTCLDNEKEKFTQTKVPIGAFLEEYFMAAELEEKYKTRVLECKVPESFDYKILIDVEKTVRVLDNLFSNAFKYSENKDKMILGAYLPKEEEIQKHLLKIENATKNRQQQYVIFYVEDTGIGIEADKVEKIFDRLYMVSDARTPEKTKGSGLGLAISKLIVEKEGGVIWCESKLDVGTVIKVMLPYSV